MLRVIQWVFKPETVLMFLKLKQTEILKKATVTYGSFHVYSFFSFKTHIFSSKIK